LSQKKGSEAALQRALIDMGRQCVDAEEERDALRENLALTRRGNVALCAVFEAAAEVCDAWEAAASHADAKAKLQTAVEAYRELVAPLGEYGGAKSEKTESAP
jgi:hypothetical protein